MKEALHTNDCVLPIQDAKLNFLPSHSMTFNASALALNAAWISSKGVWKALDQSLRERGQREYFKIQGVKRYLELESQLLHANSHHISCKNCFWKWSCTELSCTWGISPSPQDVPPGCGETAGMVVRGQQCRSSLAFGSECVGVWQIGKTLLKGKLGRWRWTQRKEEKKRIVG